MEKSSIHQQLVGILSEYFGFDAEKIDPAHYETPLFLPPFAFSVIHMLYLLAIVEAQFSVSFADCHLKNGGFLSINRIAQQLSEIESTPTLGNKA